MNNIKKKTTLIVLGIVTILSGIYTATSIYWTNQTIVDSQNEYHQRLDKSYALISKRLDSYLSKRLSGLLAQQNIISAFKERDRKKLYALTQKKYQVIKNELPSYLILHFHMPDHKSFLRVHKPKLHGDDLSILRPMIASAIRGQHELKGFEVGKYAIIYRIVRPIFHEGEFLGVLEIGADIDFIIAELQQFFGLQSCFFTKEENLSSYQPEKEFPKVGESLLFASSNMQLFRQLDSLDFGSENKQKINGKNYMFFRSVPVINFEGLEIGNLVFAHDITNITSRQKKIIIQTVGLAIFLITLVALALEKSLGRLVADLVMSNQRAMEAETAKGMFLANMSHEIRTPMNAIIGMTGLALETPLNEKQHYLLNSVKSASDSLLGLLNDILDFSKIEAGQLHLDKHPFSITGLLESVKAILSLSAAEKKLRLEIHLDLATGQTSVLGDESRIRQVLINLVNNAIKFSHEGVILIKAQRDDDVVSSNGAVWRFSVVDNGVGIPLEKQDTVFQSFNQADTSTARTHGGTGLGLAISKQLVELMGGRLWLKSELGKGSTFQFTVPLESGGDDISQISEQPSSPVFKKLRILLVEDNQFNRDIAQMILEQNGHQVICAFDGLAGLETLAHDESFDVVLMDVQMPVMDGYEASRVIRACERGELLVQNLPVELIERLRKVLYGRHLTIVAITANAMRGDREKCLKAGMDDYMTKPFLPETVVSTLQRVAGGGRSFPPKPL